MNLPDLTNTERMARLGRLSVLRSERRKCAEKLRDAVIPVINATGDVDVTALHALVDDIQKLDELIKVES